MLRYRTTAWWANASCFSGRSPKENGFDWVLQRLLESGKGPAAGRLGEKCSAAEKLVVVLAGGQRLMGQMNRQRGVIGAEKETQHPQVHTETQLHDVGMRRQPIDDDAEFKKRPPRGGLP